MEGATYIHAVEISFAGPWSQGTKAGPFVFSSGQIPVRPETMKVESTGVREQVQQCMRNLDTVFRLAGGSIQNAVKITVFLLDYGDFNSMNEAYQEFFQDNYPSRTCVTVKDLPVLNGIQVRTIIEGTAYIP